MTIPRWFGVDENPFDPSGVGGTTGVPDETSGLVSRPVTPSWASSDPITFYGIRDLIQEQFGQYVGLTATEVGRILDDFGQSYYNTSQGGWPTWAEVTQSGELLTSLERRAVHSDVLPSTFIVDTPTGRVIYQNNAGNVVPTAAAGLGEFTYQGKPAALVSGGRLAAPPGAGNRIAIDENMVPQMTEEQVNEVLNLAALDMTPAGGGGGGRRVVYDKDQLAEAIRDRWRTIMREEPADVYGLVDEYITAANDFLNQGGAKDFDTWILNRMRSTPKYRTLYEHKDGSQSELDYLNSFVGQVNQFGLDARVANAHVVRGLISGPAPASFAESVAQSADVQGIGTGDMSRRFASLLQQLGPLQGA